MIRSIIVTASMVLATPAIACYPNTSFAGNVRNYSNEKGVAIIDRGEEAKTSALGGNYWSVTNVEGQSSSILNIGINTDKEQSGIKGILFSFHTKRPALDWEPGYSETFAPYKSLGQRVDEIDYSQFGCGTPLTKNLPTVRPGYFGSQLTDMRGASIVDMLWYLDANRSTATLTAVEDRSTSGPGEITIEGTLNLVYVNPLNDRWRNGGKIKTGPVREVSITLTKFQLVKN